MSIPPQSVFLPSNYYQMTLAQQQAWWATVDPGLAFLPGATAAVDPTVSSGTGGNVNSGGGNTGGGVSGIISPITSGVGTISQISSQLKQSKLIAGQSAGQAAAQQQQNFSTNINNAIADQKANLNNLSQATQNFQANTDAYNSTLKLNQTLIDNNNAQIKLLQTSPSYTTTTWTAPDDKFTTTPLPDAQAKILALQAQNATYQSNIDTAKSALNRSYDNYSTQFDKADLGNTSLGNLNPTDPTQNQAVSNLTGEWDDPDIVPYKQINPLSPSGSGGSSTTPTFNTDSTGFPIGAFQDRQISDAGTGDPVTFASVGTPNLPSNSILGPNPFGGSTTGNGINLNATDVNATPSVPYSYSKIDEGIPPGWSQNSDGVYVPPTDPGQTNPTSPASSPAAATTFPADAGMLKGLGGIGLDIGSGYGLFESVRNGSIAGALASFGGLYAGMKLISSALTSSIGPDGAGTLIAMKGSFGSFFQKIPGLGQAYNWIMQHPLFDALIVAAVIVAIALLTRKPNAAEQQIADFDNLTVYSPGTVLTLASAAAFMTLGYNINTPAASLSAQGMSVPVSVLKSALASGLSNADGSAYSGSIPYNTPIVIKGGAPGGGDQVLLFNQNGVQNATETTYNLNNNMTFSKPASATASASAVKGYIPFFVNGQPNPLAATAVNSQTGVLGATPVLSAASQTGAVAAAGAADKNVSINTGGQ